MSVLCSQLTCVGSFRSIDPLSPDLSLQHRVMVIASMTEGFRKPWWLWSLRNNWVAGCVGTYTHTPAGIDALGVAHPRLAQPVEAFWGCVLQRQAREAC